MKVTRIEEVTQSRSRVVLEEGFVFVLYKGELRRYHIREGAELADSDYQEIMQELLPRRARLRAMNLLKNRDYTVAALRKKLQQGEYPEAVVQQALDYVAAYHYTDDLRYAGQYIVFQEASRSRRRIEMDLLQKGIPGEVIAEAWQHWEEQGGKQDEAEQIRKLLRKRKFVPQMSDYKEQQKTMAYLLRKGFTNAMIRQVLREYSLDSTDFSV